MPIQIIDRQYHILHNAVCTTCAAAFCLTLRHLRQTLRETIHCFWAYQQNPITMWRVENATPSCGIFIAYTQFRKPSNNQPIKYLAMRTKTFFMYFILILASQGVMAQEQEVDLPFTGRQYHTDATAYREVGDGRGSNISTAKRKAEMKASRGLAEQVNKTVKAVTDMVEKEVETNGNLEFESEFRDVIRMSVEQQLQGAAVVNEKSVKEGSVYTYWVVMEIPKQVVINGVYESITHDEKLKLDYDKQRFEEIFNEEMRKLEEEQGQ